MGSFRVEVSHDSSALAPFRRRLDGWLKERGLSDPPRAEVVLASHEALANAIEHSASSMPVLVTAEERKDGFVVEIVDRGNWKPRRAEPDEERGRGLAMIKALVSDVRITLRAQGTTIRLFQET